MRSGPGLGDRSPNEDGAVVRWVERVAIGMWILLGVSAFVGLIVAIWVPWSHWGQVGSTWTVVLMGAIAASIAAWAKDAV